jgi:hypothetical protein
LAGASRKELAQAGLRRHDLQDEQAGIDALGEYVNHSVMAAFARDLYDPSDLTTSFVPTP